VSLCEAELSPKNIWPSGLNVHNS